MKIHRLIRHGARCIAGLGALAVPMVAFADPLGNIGTVPSSSDFPTMWTAGDPAPIAAALNAIAMLFGHGDVAGSFIAGGMSALSLVGLVGVLLTSIFKMRLLIGEYVLMMIIAILMFYPTTSVRVVSYFNANGAAGSPPLYVDNVPIGVAYALGIAGMINYRVTSGIETAFSTASSDNNFMSLGTDGFAKPLKIMLAMRTMYDCNVHQSTCTNLLNFMHYCKTGGTNHQSVLDMTQLDEPAPGAGIVGLLLSQPLNYTIYIDQSVASAPPALVPCQTAANGLVGSMQQYVQNKPVFEMLSPRGVTMGKDLATVTAMVDSTVDTPGTTYTGTDAAYQTQAQYYQNLAAQIGGDANTFMMNQVFSPAALAAIRADANPNAAAAFQQIMGEAYERARISMAASGSMFVNFMTSAMNLMTFLFAALAPIVAIIAIGAGLAAVRIYVMYFLFGLWTQTWMPIAAIISYYTQVSFNSMIRGSRVSGMMFAPSQIDHLYDNVANMLASSGSMMASAPLISFSVLTGSIFAMTSLATRSSGNGEAYVDSGRLAPTVDKASNAGAFEGSYQANTGLPAAGPGYLNALRSGTALSNADVTQSPTLQQGSSYSDGMTQNVAAQLQHQRSVSDYSKAMAQFSQRFGRQAAFQKNADFSSSGTISSDASDAASKAISSVDGQGSAVANQHSTEAGGSIRLALPGKIGPSVSLGGTSRTNDQNSTSHDERGSSDATGRTGKSARDDTSGRTGTSGSVGLSGNREEAESQVRELGLQTSRTASLMQSTQRAISASETTGAQNSISLGALAQNAQQMSQDKQIGALSRARQAIGTLANVASGGNAEQAQALIGKATDGVPKDGSYSPGAMFALYRNAQAMLRSGNMAEHALGYAIASKLAEATGYGDAQGLGRNASVLAQSAATLDNARASLGQPGLSPEQLRQSAALPGKVDGAVDKAAQKFGVSDLSNPDAVAPQAGNVAGTVGGKVGAVERKAAGVEAVASSRVAAAKDEEGKLKKTSDQRFDDWQGKHKEDPTNLLVPHQDPPVAPQPKPADSGATTAAQQLYTKPLHSRGAGDG
ncbi:conjugal transfer protein TraG N-terminal domain-containing protein [Burkholderia sp. BCC1985]|uniref:conjugal transfer protein TraG N-terminal domain-containing protein n=1 Tax=Burkholderia sp. BCC1985 TaxID=2817442 RepID=UPI002AB11C16|nr:conjugal transfer protein TraG N-terminal domain-containing protein [Burkholderia sp. BCC1985]